MLEWLKEILGENYTEEIDSKVSAEIGKGFVSKSDFNQVNTAKKKAEEDVKARDEQLENLKKSTGDLEDLKQQITALQTQNADAQKAYEKEIAKIKLANAVDSALTKAGAKNNTAVKALMTDFLKDAQLGEDGAVKGLSEVIDNLAKAESTSFLFADGGGKFKGLNPGDAGGKAPPAAGKKPEDMSYEEICTYIESGNKL